jgi:4-hydroxybenzoate polyprenyltransferase
MRLITAIQLTRLTMAVGAVADLWFVILYTSAHRQEYESLAPTMQIPMPLLLLAGAVTALGLFGFGAAINDLLDARHDMTFSPDRPIPAGQIRFSQAVVVCVGSLMASMLGGAAMGTWALYATAITAAGILFYNTTGRFIPAVGIVVVGLFHATHMMIPNVLLSFTLPVWLVMTHAMAIALGVHVLEDKRPRLSRRALGAIIVAWLFWSSIVIGLGAMRGGPWPASAGWPMVILPALAVGCFAALAWWKCRRVPGASAAEKLKRYGALFQCLYGAAWLAGLDLIGPAFVLIALGLAGLIGMTVIRELSALASRPLTWRA